MGRLGLSGRVEGEGHSPGGADRGDGGRLRCADHQALLQGGLFTREGVPDHPRPERSHFDPDVVEAFLALEDQFNRVREEKLRQEPPAPGRPSHVRPPAAIGFSGA